MQSLPPPPPPPPPTTTTNTHTQVMSKSPPTTNTHTQVMSKSSHGLRIFQKQNVQFFQKRNVQYHNIRRAIQSGNRSCFSLFFFFFFFFFKENIRRYSLDEPHRRVSNFPIALLILLLNTTCPVLTNSVDPDKLASKEAN